MMNRTSKPIFKLLQNMWYDVLKKDGFDDIEKYTGEKLVLVQSASKFYRHLNDDCERQAKEDYYTFVSRAVQDEETKFRNEADKHILSRHADGAEIKTIVQELIALGTPRDRASIRIIIRRYVMEWKIRPYSRKELKLKAHG